MHEINTKLRYSCNTIKMLQEQIVMTEEDLLSERILLKEYINKYNYSFEESKKLNKAIEVKCKLIKLNDDIITNLKKKYAELQSKVYVHIYYS